MQPPARPARSEQSSQQAKRPAPAESLRPPGTHLPLSARRSAAAGPGPGSKLKFEDSEPPGAESEPARGGDSEAEERRGLSGTGGGNAGPCRLLITRLAFSNLRALLTRTKNDS